MLNDATFEIFGPVRKVVKGGDTRKWLRLTVPVDRSFTDGDDKKVERTSWVDAVCFKPKLIDIIEKLNVEGRRVRLRGTIDVNQRDFEGKKITDVSFYIDSLDLTDPKPRDDA